jgi:hypothetical protein
MLYFEPKFNLTGSDVVLRSEVLVRFVDVLKAVDKESVKVLAEVGLFKVVCIFLKFAMLSNCPIPLKE